jgi:photosystem II stability/assembly factor-like uncharacterized protein
MVLSLARGADGEIYLGTNDGHVFASDERVDHWELRGRAGGRTDAVVAQLAADQREPQHLFAAVWFQEAVAGGGVYRSENGGRSWALAGLQSEAVRALEFAPSQPQVLVAGTRSGVFRSSDSGKTWERISPSDDPELRNVDSVAIDPADAKTIYAGTYHLPWKTSDGGETWKPVTAGLIDDSDIMSLRVDATNPARLYLSACSGIYRSDNRGEQWTKLQGIPYSARRTQAILQDPANPGTLYAATTEGLWVTRDAGENWQRTTPRDWVVNGVVVVPATPALPSRVLIGTEAQGALLSSDFGKTFTSANHGFTHQVVKQLAADAGHPSHLLLLLDRGGGDLLESRDTGKTWETFSATVPATKAFAWNAQQIARIYGSPWGWVAALRNGSLWIFDQRSRAWEPWRVSYVVPAKAPKKAAKRQTVSFRGLLEFSNAHAYLPVPEGLLRCDRGGGCAIVPGFTRLSAVSALHSSADDQFLAVATDGKLGISRDGGKSAVWRDLPSDLRATVWLFADESGGQMLLGCERGLFASSDAGERWIPVREGLPASVVEGGLRSSKRLVMALQVGIYTAAQIGGGWTRLDRDAERGRITNLIEVQPGSFLFGSESEGILLWRLADLEAEHSK